MQILIDESGDCGMLIPPSSASFALVAVLFESTAAAEACDAAIGTLRKTLGLPGDFEFHFSTNSAKQRKAFLELSAKYEFLYLVSTIDKQRLTGRRWEDKEFFYDEACRRLVNPLEELLRIAQACGGGPGKALIDDNQDSVYFEAVRRHLKSLKAENGRPLIKKAKPQRSRTANLLQLADMVCGAQVYLQKHGTDEYTRLIHKRRVADPVWP